MLPALNQYCQSLVNDFSLISDERKSRLEKISNYISEKSKEGKTANLIYICTHNSRRSQFGQVWAQAAANYYNVRNVFSYSGGTEVTAFHKNAANALIRAGFHIERPEDGTNPVFYVTYDDASFPGMCFSKKYDHVDNPPNNFLAVLTCSEADEACPNIHNEDLRVSTTYEDPKAFDGTDLQDAKYDERCKQIALETLYVFSKVK
ncbi:MAG: protein-tyrosine-phosphatase [Bacteroidetes bacterium]|nr:protein-tyrosine-phosphatase [Bacteroidota bacterium]